MMKVKQWVIAVVALAVMFGMVGCRPQTCVQVAHEITEYQIAAIDALRDYMSGKTNDNFYSETAYKEFAAIIGDGTVSIIEAEDNAAVDAALNEAKGKMDKIKTIEVKGEFYTLQDAYKNGYITREELQSIANRRNSYLTDDSGENATEATDEIAPKIAQAIKKEYAESRGSRVEEVVLNFYGQFGNCAAVDVCLSGDAFATVISEVDIDGVLFVYPEAGREIVIWKY